MDGLAKMGVGQGLKDGSGPNPGQGQGVGGPPQGQKQMITQVVQMLLQGVTPEELLRQGVPKSVIEKAVMVIQNRQQQQQVPMQEQGLANMAQ